ncbi:MAG: amidohydrolase family protein [Pseudomonadota bacterium]
MKIIDAHHHLWAPQTPALDVGYVWLKDIGAMKPFGDPTPIQRDYLLPEFLENANPHEIIASVHVQADPRLPDPVAESAFIQKISDESAQPIMIVGFADLKTDAAAETVQQHKAHRNLRGIRQILSHLPDRPEISFAATNLLDNPTWRAQFAALAAQDMRFDLQLYPEQMLQAADLIAACPHVPVVIDHLGSPYDQTAAGRALWADGMQALAQIAQVHVKLSGYAMFFQGDLSDGARQVTQDILTWFGPERCMFGSNFPVDSLHLAYPDLVDFVASEVGANALDAVFANTAARFYNV